MVYWASPQANFLKPPKKNKSKTSQAWGFQTLEVTLLKTFITKIVEKVPNWWYRNVSPELYNFSRVMQSRAWKWIFGNSFHILLSIAKTFDITDFLDRYLNVAGAMPTISCIDSKCSGERQGEYSLCLLFNVISWSTIQWAGLTLHLAKSVDCQVVEGL